MNQPEPETAEFAGLDMSQKVSITEFAAAMLHVDFTEDASCPCVNRSPEDYDGPVQDCPIHGDPAIVGHAQEPIQLRWGLDDVMYGDDDTTTVMLSGEDRQPYWLTLEPERAAAMRDALGGPDAGEPATVTAPGPYSYVDDDGFCLSARRLPDLDTGGITDTLSISIEADDPQSVHVPVAGVAAVATGIRTAAGLPDPAATILSIVADWAVSSEGRDVLIEDLKRAGHPMPEATS